jgi:hypothetical protein
VIVEATSIIVRYWEIETTSSYAKKRVSYILSPPAVSMKQLAFPSQLQIREARYEGVALVDKRRTIGRSAELDIRKLSSMAKVLAKAKLSGFNRPLSERRIRSVFSRMNNLALFLFVLWTVFTPPCVGQDKSIRQAFNGSDRTITWKPWHQSPQGEYRFRTGDRYLGHEVWEHYLCFEQNRSSLKAVKLSRIHLGNDQVQEQVEICPGLRYGLLKITDDKMTAHKGVWSWTAQEVVNQRLVENAGP